MKKHRNLNPNAKIETTSPPTSLRWRQKLTFAAYFTGLIVILILFGIMAGIAQQRNALDELLSRWKNVYHLTDEQAAHIRKIELDFHGNGNPFISRSMATPEENANHYLDISHSMNPEDGDRFMKTKGGNMMH